MRFSIRGLLILTAVVGVASAVFFAVPDWLAAIVLLFAAFITPGALVAGIVYGKGYGRAFSIGALLASGWVYVPYMYFIGVGLLSGEVENFVEYTSSQGIVWLKIAFAVQSFLTVAMGLTVVGVRWLCLRSAAKVRPVMNQAILAAPIQPEPPAVSIEPRDKAELYAILQGRVGT